MDYVAEIKNRLGIDFILQRIGLVKNKSGFVSSIYRPGADRTPSMHIKSKQNTYFCYSTNQGGDIIQLWQDYYGIDFKQALKELCELAGIKYDAAIGDTIKPTPRRFEQKFEDILNKPAIESMDPEELEDYYTNLGNALEYNNDEMIEVKSKRWFTIREIEEEILNGIRKDRMRRNVHVFSELYDYCRKEGFNNTATDYLTKVRKLPEEILQRHMVFSIDNYNQVSNHMKKIFRLPQLKRSGLFNDKGNLVFFKHRIIIPYIWQGWIVYLRARYFDENNNHQCEGSKYIGLHNDGLGVNTAKRFYNDRCTEKMFQGEHLYITEGEFDAMALDSLGFNAIAIPGVGNLPRSSKFKKLLKFEIFLCSDNDVAGSELQKRLIGIFKGFNKPVTLKIIPNKDINDFVAA